MKGVLFKDTIREIRHSLGRFLSIFGIVLVGVAFFTGVKASSPYMKHSADAYFDHSNLFDLKMYAPTGFSEEEISMIRKTKGIQGVEGAYSLDLLTQVDDTERVVQVMSCQTGAERGNVDYMNQLTVVSGRLPKKSGECVLRDYGLKNGNFEIGDTISFTSGTQVPVEQMVAEDTCTIVGFVTTPYYLSYQYDAASIGSGKVELVAFLPVDDFLSPRYTVAYATVRGAELEDTYSDTYFEVTNPVKERLEQQQEDWRIFDRKSHFSYVDYENCAKRMEAIAKVFPVFFYLVAALVCLTTMTRMVDEQRGLIGTEKALGYHKIQIAMKYIIYALTASLLGGAAGCAVGLNVFPRIIFSSWNIVYTVEKLVPFPQVGLCILAILIAVGVTVAAAVCACMGELIETPALLLRPKAPKNGKKIILERLPFLWKHFSFSQKVTARNLLRYKKRFFMTVIGIAGCTALILAGYGIKNSVSTVVNRQYGEILAYDLSGTLRDECQEKEFVKQWKQDERVTDLYVMTQESYQASQKDDQDGGTKNVTLISVDNSADYEKFTTLYRAKDEKKIKIPEDGALISYKMAKDYDLKKGSIFYVCVQDNQYVKVRVADIITMYVGQYVFMNDKYYEQVFDKPAPRNSFVSTLASRDEREQQTLGSEMMEEGSVESISYYDGIQSTFEDMISSMDLITVVLIISAALLAFIVLYNLINVNVSERLREIATIKVLGFYDPEVALYVYRENVILSVIGALTGLLLGMLLHGYIMSVIEMDDVIFPRMIFLSSYLLAVSITIFFGLAVNLMMYHHLQKIPMVESLKSVE